MAANSFTLSVRAQIEVQTIMKAHGMDNSGKVQKVIDSEVLRRNADYIPFDTGALRDSGSTNTQLGSGEVVYSTPYARKQYYIPMNHEGQRCAYWFEHMKSDGGLQKILEAAKKAAGAK